MAAADPRPHRRVDRPLDAGCVSLAALSGRFVGRATASDGPARSASRCGADRTTCPSRARARRCRHVGVGVAQRDVRHDMSAHLGPNVALRDVHPPMALGDQRSGWDRGGTAVAGGWPDSGHDDATGDAAALGAELGAPTGDRSRGFRVDRPTRYTPCRPYRPITTPQMRTSSPRDGPRILVDQQPRALMTVLEARRVLEAGSASRGCWAEADACLRGSSLQLASTAQIRTVPTPTPRAPILAADASGYRKLSWYPSSSIATAASVGCSGR